MSSIREEIAAREAALEEKNREIDAQSARVNEEATAALKSHPTRLHKLISVSEAKDVPQEDLAVEENNNEKMVKNPTPMTRMQSMSKRRSQMQRKPSEDSDDQESVGGSMGSEATIRYQKAQLKVLEDEVEAQSDQLQEFKLKCESLKSELKATSSEKTSLNKKLLHSETVLEKLRNEKAVQDTKYDAMEGELCQIRKEMEEIRRSEKKAQQNDHSTEVRLHRALDELEKVKNKLRNVEADQQSRVIARQEFDKVKKENDKLEKQKKELLIAFKKQMKLIDILKRQKIHMEAAKLLSFTEEEFSKTLELGSLT